MSFILIMLAGAFRAYVVTVLWSWFVMPRFDAAPLTFWLTYGLLLTLSLVNMQGLKVSVLAVTEKDPTIAKRAKWINTIFVCLMPAIVLGMAWIVKQLL